MGKKLFSKLVFAFMFFICILFTQKDTAKADVYLDMDNTTITEENAVVSVMSYSDNVPIKAITIVVKKDGEEIKRSVLKVNTHESERYTVDFKNDLGITLEKDSLYEYTVIQDFEFYGEAYAVGQFYTGSDCYVTVYMTRKNKNDYIFRSECIPGLITGDKFHYNAKMYYDQGEDMCFEKINIYDVGYEIEYEIDCLSENPDDNIIRSEYSYVGAVLGSADIGAVYLINSDTGEVIKKGIISAGCRDEKIRYVPNDVVKVNEQYYMYDAKRTGSTYVAYISKPFYENIFNIYYKPCSVPGETTSVTVQYMDTSTDRQIKTETISDQKIGNGYEYLPVNTFSDGTYQYTYCAEDTRNELKLEKLWTNPENNILTVYYKLAPENNESTVSDQTASEEQPQNQTNPIQKEKPVIKKAKLVIKKISRKNKSAIKIKFSKIKKAQGYEICYSTKKSFKKSVTKRVKKTTVTLKNLKKRKTYYVKVRGYQTIDGKVYYSKYSKVKRI